VGMVAMAGMGAIVDLTGEATAVTVEIAQQEEVGMVAMAGMVLLGAAKVEWGVAVLLAMATKAVMAHENN